MFFSRSEGLEGNVRPISSISPDAMEFVRAQMQPFADQENIALWIEIAGVVSDRYLYDLSFDSILNAKDGDSIDNSQDVTVVIPRQSVGRLKGSRLEYSIDDGLVLTNPNLPSLAELARGVPVGVFEAGIDSLLARQVIKALDEDVNPSIAGHGGRAELVALDVNSGIAYIRLCGGCQGCAMSLMTLREGIETVVLDLVPEITELVDITDHGGGKNPYL